MLFFDIKQADTERIFTGFYRDRVEKQTNAIVYHRLAVFWSCAIKCTRFTIHLLFNHFSSLRTQLAIILFGCFTFQMHIYVNCISFLRV